MNIPGDAIISDCGTYRYVLKRHISQVIRWVKPCLFVMLNPSTATAETNDPTIVRCTGFASSWGCTSLTVVNLFGLRATDPAELGKHPSPFGADNEKHVMEQLDAHWNTGVVVVAWGANKAARHHRLINTIYTLSGKVSCLGINKDGSPKHPLYVKADQPLIPWSMAA